MAHLERVIGKYLFRKYAHQMFRYFGKLNKLKYFDLFSKQFVWPSIEGERKPNLEWIIENKYVCMRTFSELKIIVHSIFASDLSGEYHHHNEIKSKRRQFN